MTPIPPFKKLLCANRGEIAIRVFRAATELGIRTVSIYSHEDRVHLHRYKADESYLVGRDSTPVGAYLAIEEIIEIAKSTGVEAIHPGYGFLSERADFAEACDRAGIVFVGPPAKVLKSLGDKISARQLAIENGIPVVPGSDGAVSDVAEAKAFGDEHGYPLLLKASMGVVVAACGWCAIPPTWPTRSRRRVRRRRRRLATVRSSWSAIWRSRATSRCKSSATPTVR